MALWYVTLTAKTYKCLTKFDSGEYCCDIIDEPLVALSYV